MLDEGCGCPGTGTGPIAGAVPYVPLASYLPIDELEVNVMVAYKTVVDVDIVVVVAGHCLLLCRYDAWWF